MKKLDLIREIEYNYKNSKSVDLSLDAVDRYSSALLQQAQCTTLLPDVEQVIKSRIEYFNSNYQKYECKELSDAIRTIKRLVPPSMFEDFIRQ